jgi:hypothetical protein
VSKATATVLKRIGITRQDAEALALVSIGLKLLQVAQDSESESDTVLALSKIDAGMARLESIVSAPPFDDLNTPASLPTNLWARSLVKRLRQDPKSLLVLVDGQPIGIAWLQGLAYAIGAARQGDWQRAQELRRLREAALMAAFFGPYGLLWAASSLADDYPIFEPIKELFSPPRIPAEHEWVMYAAGGALAVGVIYALFVRSR